MVAADGLRQLLCTPSRVRTRVLGSHIACMENSAAKLLGVQRNVGRIWWLPTNSTSILNHSSILDLLALVVTGSMLTYLPCLRLPPPTDTWNTRWSPLHSCRCLRSKVQSNLECGSVGDNPTSSMRALGCTRVNKDEWSTCQTYAISSSGM